MTPYDPSKENALRFPVLQGTTSNLVITTTIPPDESAAKGRQDAITTDNFKFEAPDEA